MAPFMIFRRILETEFLHRLFHKEKNKQGTHIQNTTMHIFVSLLCVSFYTYIFACISTKKNISYQKKIRNERRWQNARRKKIEIKTKVNIKRKCKQRTVSWFGFWHILCKYFASHFVNSISASMCILRLWMQQKNALFILRSCKLPKNKLISNPFGNVWNDQKLQWYSGNDVYTFWESFDIIANQEKNWGSRARIILMWIKWEHRRKKHTSNGRLTVRNG